MFADVDATGCESASYATRSRNICTTPSGKFVAPLLDGEPGTKSATGFSARSWVSGDEEGAADDQI